MENSPVIASYLRRVDPIPRPSREEEITLVQRACSGDREMTDRLVRAHVAFVIRVAMEFRGRGVPFEDLVHEGCLGLLKAVRRFDPDNGARFMTYAAFWVRKSILDTLDDQGRLVHVPRYQRTQHGRPLSKEISLDEPVAGDADRTFADALADTTVPLPEAELIARESIRRVRRHLHALPARDRAVLSSRYGLQGGPAMTLMEVGARLSISRERVRQIETSALAQLRRAMTRKPFRSFDQNGQV